MKNFAFIDTSGNILYTASPENDSDYEDGRTYGECVARALPESIDMVQAIATLYWKEGAWKARSQSPGAYYEWDAASESWLPNLDAARESKLQQVSAELNARLYLPCNGFDADKVSRERISGMIARLQRGDGLPVGWVGWRDADNQQQWAADDAATVLANLSSLSRAIEDREQSILIRGWQHKAAIAALADVTSILNYDTSSGW